MATHHELTPQAVPVAHDDADAAVLDPDMTVRTDVERLRAAPYVSERIAISGHVYDVGDWARAHGAQDVADCVQPF
jgi:hypothetical protein